MNLRNLFKKKLSLSEVSSIVDKFSLDNSQKFEHILLTNGIPFENLNRDAGRLFFVLYNEMIISQSFDITISRGKGDVFSEHYRGHINYQLFKNNYFIESYTFYNSADFIIDEINEALFYNKTNTATNNPATRLAMVYLNRCVIGVNDFDEQLIDKIANALENHVTERNNTVYSINF